MNDIGNPKLPRKYSFTMEEPRLFSKWQADKLYQFDLQAIDDLSNVFTIDTPPPYTNASWHIGGAIHYSQIDMIARAMRMFGKTVYFPMGLDRNGLPIEIAAEKEYSVNMHQMDREEFLLLCKKILDKFGSQILEVAYKLGMSCNSFDWENVYKTDHASYRALTQATFIKMWHSGLIYEDDRPNNWDYRLQTTVADAEIEYIDEEHILYEIEFSVKNSKKSYSFSTTRPELIPAIRVIVYHPADKRYHHLQAEKAVIPIWDISVEILPHHMVDPDFGTGLVQICSFGDIQDIRVIREFNLKPVYAIGLDGKMTEASGKYQGMTIKAARKAIINDLYLIGAIKSETTIKYKLPISERSKAPIEFIGMNEYYLKQEAYLGSLRAYGEKISFYPESSKMIWDGWLDRISMDWPISRRRFYGTEVPIWYCEDCNAPNLPKPGEYYQPWKDKPPFEKCTRCGNDTFTGDLRTFDTWMDSSISALYILKYPNNIAEKKLLEHYKDRNFLVDLRPQGKDIVRTWLHYSMLRIHHLENKQAFDGVWISGHVVTESGEKMSKSGGNAISPEVILKEYGGDALRFYGTIEGSHGSDIRFSQDRLKGISKFLNKLYNIARLIASFQNPSKRTPCTVADQWIMGELNQTKKLAYEGYHKFDFHPAAKAIRSFTNDTFASHYLELVKARAYNRDSYFSKEDQNSAISTLYNVLEEVLRLLAPIAPFMTDYLYLKMFGTSVHCEQFKDIEDFPFQHNFTEYLVAFNSKIWKQKKELKRSLRSEISDIVIPNQLIGIKDDLVKMHNIVE